MSFVRQKFGGGQTKTATAFDGAKLVSSSVNAYFAGGGNDYANEPAGMTLVARCLCDQVPVASPGSKPAGWTNVWSSFASSDLGLEDDPSAPVNGPTVLRTRFPTDLEAGNAPGANFAATWNSGGLPEDIGECSELFIGMWFKIVGQETGDYEQQSTGTKWGWVSGPNVTGANNDFFFFMPGPGGSSPILVNSIPSARFNQQNLVARNLTPNVGSEAVDVATWTKIEAYLVTNTIGVDNGIFQMWVNGTLTQSYNDVRYRDASFPRKFVTYRWNPTWGGTGGGNKTRDDDVWFCDIYISGKL